MLLGTVPIPDQPTVISGTSLVSQAFMLLLSTVHLSPGMLLQGGGAMKLVLGSAFLRRNHIRDGLPHTSG